MAVSGEPRLLDRFFEFRLVPYDRPSHEGPTVTRLAGVPDCQLAILEFDDQGLCFDRRAMNDLTDTLQGLTNRNPIIIAFAHGWKHNAAAPDTNLVAFTGLVRETAERGGGRPVLGVYASWRGLSRDGNWLWAQSSFWNRRSAAQRVALGSVRELLGRLKAFRNGPPQVSGAPRATLVVIGHSFGGLLVYSAVAQSLIEAAATQEKVVPSFGDLVLLVNPAFSAVSYLPIHEIVQTTRFAANLLPVCVAVTATNDWATKYAYPLGTWPKLINEAWRTSHEREAIVSTMGHLPWMRTHEISGAVSATASPHPKAGGTMLRTLSDRDARVSELTFRSVRLCRLSNVPSSPFWVVSAAPEVVNGHNGILQEPFKDFVRELVDAHVAKGAEA